MKQCLLKKLAPWKSPFGDESLKVKVICYSFVFCLHFHCRIKDLFLNNWCQNRGNRTGRTEDMASHNLGVMRLSPKLGVP